MTLRIIVGMLTIILIVTGILPFMTNKTLAAENVLSDNIILVTENEVSDTAKDGRVNPVGLSLYTLVYISLPNFAFRCGDGSIVLAEVNGKNYR